MYNPLSNRLYAKKGDRILETSAAHCKDQARAGWIHIKASSVEDALNGIGEKVHICLSDRKSDVDGV